MCYIRKMLHQLQVTVSNPMKSTELQRCRACHQIKVTFKRCVHECISVWSATPGFKLQGHHHACMYYYYYYHHHHDASPDPSLSVIPYSTYDKVED